ncbi:MAG: pyruvate kinase, partial [Acetatifactor sp.]|nr:pyruvate kinase [Acetatifactor sp.]
THEEQRVKFERVLQAREELGLPVATLLDTKGPEIRLRDFEGGRAELVCGQRFILTTREILGNADRASITYTNLKNDISAGTTILIDDGLIEMNVEEISGEDIVCRVINGGAVSNHKGVNVPGAVLSMPYISDADREDILFGIEMGYEFLAASFARTKDDILEVRKILKDHGSDMKIIAKIENMQGIENLEEILEVSDGIMVARGDMGVEIPLEEVPILQKKMIHLANAQGKHVITATQMLESMIKNPRPTRAEATDIANAIYDGTTAIMLSGESAAGKYPVEAVQTMAKIAECAEKDIDYRARTKLAEHDDKADITTAIAYATCTAAMDLHAAAIITVTMSGFTAEAIARFKPRSQVIGCTTNERVYHQLNLLWGVTPLMLEKENTTDDLLASAVTEAKKAGCVK